MKNIFNSISIILFTFFTISYSQTTILHSFNGPTNDGGFPWDSVLKDGSTLYGMTELGGAVDGGTVFKIGADGNNFQILHSFYADVDPDGYWPTGGLIKDGYILFGMTYWGGEYDEGIIFRVETNGSGYKILHSFETSNPNDGAHPLGSLLQDGSTLYGMTCYGGYYDLGSIFKIQTNGSGFELLHSFNYHDFDNGGEPTGALIQDGQILYGMTYYGGYDDAGTVFRINKDGSEFELLHDFSHGDISNGEHPENSLLLVDSYLYGTTEEGGFYDAGTVFRIKTDGSSFEILHSFADNPSDGGFPGGTLIKVGSILYGVTWEGGNNDYGTIFGISLDGSSYSVLHSFTGNPVSLPILPSIGSAELYSVEKYLSKVLGDREQRVHGPLSKIQFDNNTRSFSKVSADIDGAFPWWGSLAYGSGKLYGMTITGGEYNWGTIFKFSLSLVISGYAKDNNGNPIEGVEISFDNGSSKVFTNEYGYYVNYVPKEWTGTSTAEKDGWTFSPASYDYPAHLTEDQTKQNFIGKSDGVNISGRITDNFNIGIEGVAVMFSNGGDTVYTDLYGRYITSVSNGWTGTSTPLIDGWFFSPEFIEYSERVTYDLEDQDYVGTNLSLDVYQDLSSFPKSFSVLPAYPNPFNPNTTITYGLDNDSKVSIQIYDISGKLVTTLLNTEQRQGWYNIEWNGIDNNNKSIPAGIYLCKITSDVNTKTIKLMLLK